MKDILYIRKVTEIIVTAPLSLTRKIESLRCSTPVIKEGQQYPFVWLVT